MARTKYYALYRGDEHICDGTIEEIAKKQGVKVRTIEFYKSPTYKKRTKGRGYLLIEIGD